MDTDPQDFVVKLKPCVEAQSGVPPKNYPDRREEAARYQHSSQHFVGIHYTNDPITVRCNDRRKHELGILIGPSPKYCDIVVSDNTNSHEESPAWGLITYDAYNRLIYRDVRHPPPKVDGRTNDEENGNDDDNNDDTCSHMSEGSGVTLDAIRLEAKDKRRGFTWVLSGSVFLLSKSPRVTIHLNDYIRLEVSVPDGGRFTKEHLARVKSFQKAPSVHKMKDPDTRHFEKTLCLAPNAWVQDALQTCLHNAQNDIILKGQAGQGSYGQVFWNYNLSTGHCKGVKYPHDQWKVTQALKEIDLFEKIAQYAKTDKRSEKYSRFLIKYIGSEREPEVKLELEYVINGTLKEQHQKRRMCILESLCAMEQILKATSFLHRFNIAHRDIKPENVLVKYRSPKYQRTCDLEIRLADLGSGKLGGHESTDVGTFTYNAPELFREINSPYTKAVDIWSIGVMFYDIYFGLAENIKAMNEPIHSPAYAIKGSKMCEMIETAIEKKARSHEPDAILAKFLCKHMVQRDATKRLSADDCLYKIKDVRHKLVVRDGFGVELPDHIRRQAPSPSQVVETASTTASAVSTMSATTMSQYSSRSTAKSTVFAHAGGNNWPTPLEKRGPSHSNTSSINMPDVLSDSEADFEMVDMDSDTGSSDSSDGYVSVSSKDFIE